MKIGSYEIENVEFSVIQGENSPDLLGLNALLRPSNNINININARELSF